MDEKTEKADISEPYCINKSTKTGCCDLDSEKIFNLWATALVLFALVMALVDAFYVMPNYLPPSYLAGDTVYSPRNPAFLQYLYSLLKIVLGIPLILLHLGSSNLAFGAGFWGTAASSALVSYTLLIPYVAALMFVIPGKTGVPPAYRVFQTLITNTGARKVSRAANSAGHAANLSALTRANKHHRSDKYQALLEAEELEDVARFIAQDVNRLGEINSAYEALLVARTNAKIAATSNQADTLLDEVKDAKHALHEAQATQTPSWMRRQSDAAKRFAGRDRSTHSTSSTAAEAERVKAQADALNAVREAYRLQVQKEEWEKRQR